MLLEREIDEAVKFCVYKSEMMKIFLGEYPEGKLIYHRGFWLKVKRHLYPTDIRGYGLIELEATDRKLVPSTVWWRVNPDGTVEKRIPESWRGKE